MGACFGFDYNLNVRSCNLSSNSREFVPLENSTDVFFIQCEKTGKIIILLEQAMIL